MIPSLECYSIDAFCVFIEKERYLKNNVMKRFQSHDVI